MSRSIWKGPYVEKSLLKKVYNSLEKENHKPIRTWSRKSTILPEFSGLAFQVYNGHKWMTVRVSEDMIGHKLGEFCMTRKPCIHKKKKK